MKTISIGTQSSMAELVNAFAAALAAEIGWTADDEGNVKKDGISVFFKFAAVGTNRVSVTVSNGYTSGNTDMYCTFSAANTYKLYLLETLGGSIAVGISVATGAPILGTLIVRNTAGAYVGISFSSNTIPTLRGIESATRTVLLSLNGGDGVSTAVTRMPDIWGDAVFNDLYYVISCPYKSTDRVFYIKGKTFRSVGTGQNYMYFALPEE